MGKTYRRNSEERFTDQRRSEKTPKRAKRGGGKLKTLNSNVDIDYDDYDDYFDDEVELYDEITIRHSNDTP
jgi:hypothetical protein